MPDNGDTGAGILTHQYMCIDTIYNQLLALQGGGVGWFANDLHALVNINVLFFIPATANPLYREFQFLHSYTSDAGFGR